jgi:hypothetical protein
MPLSKINRPGLNTGVTDNSDATAVTIDSSERVGIGASPSAKLQVDNGSTHADVIVKGGDATTNYSGGSLLLANPGMATNYGGTYLYHHKAGGSGNTNAAFNISQRNASGGYVSNIWNVDYQNNVQSFYLPNGQQSGASVLNINSNGSVTMGKQPYVVLQGNNSNNITWNNNDRIGATDDGTSAWSVPSFVNMNYNSNTGALTVPTGGVYAVYLQAYYNGGGPNNVRIAIRKNASQVAMSHRQSILYGTLHVNVLINMAANDYFDFQHVSGGDRTFYEGIAHTYAYVVKLT